nr:hypothetical protein [Streptomyces collinus]
MRERNTYSVPVRFIGRQLRVLLHANVLIVYDGRTVVTRHERLSGRNDSRLILDHYLEALLRKPGTFPGSTALEQARSAGRFTPVHDKSGSDEAAHGDAAGTRALIEVLLGGRCRLRRGCGREDSRRPTGTGCPTRRPRATSLADLTLNLWRTFRVVTARRIAQKAAAHVGGQASLVEATEHRGARLRLSWWKRFTRMGE